MASVRSTNTMSEGLAKLVQMIGGMKMLPDADREFLDILESAIIDYAREIGLRAMVGAEQGGMGGGLGGDMMGGLGGGLPGGDAGGGLPMSSAPTPPMRGQGPAGVMQAPVIPPGAGIE